MTDSICERWVLLSMWHTYRSRPRLQGGTWTKNKHNLEFFTPTETQ